MARRSANLEVMVRAAMKAGRHLARDFGEVEQLQVSIKGPGDFVSNADTRAERTIRDELTKARPEYGFLLEESGIVKAKDGVSYFIVDPLDGTTNFLHGIPHFAVSIALYVRDEVQAAVIYDPIKDELYTAEKGNGAFLNDRRIRASGRSDLAACVIGCGLPVQKWKGRSRGFTEQMNAVADHAGGLRRLGAAALDLAYVASGRQDGYWEYGVKSWDIAAGILIVREAGGRIGRLEGDDKILHEGTIVAATGGIYPRLRQILEAATPPAPVAQAS